MVKKQRSFASRSSSSSRPGLERAVLQADPPGSTADGPDDDAASVLSQSSSGGEWVRGNTKVSSKHRSHGTPGPKSPVRRPTQCSNPARSQASDLAGKCGAGAVSQVIPSGSNSADGPSQGPGLYRKLSLAALTLLTDRPPTGQFYLGHAIAG